MFHSQSMTFIALLVQLLLICQNIQSKIITSKSLRNEYISDADIWFEIDAAEVSKKDMYNGPSNPYNLKTGQTLDCDFVEPDPLNPTGGTTPKFYCSYLYKGETVKIKIKYDQQYNEQLPNWGNANYEVYAAPISQRLLWATGFGADHSVPIAVNCKNCPIEPWTYIQAVQGYNKQDVLTRWMNMELIENGGWKQKTDVLSLPLAIAYFPFDEYYDAVDILYSATADNANTTKEGFAWPELTTFPSYEKKQVIARQTLSVIAAFLSHCDNFDGNQAFVCLYPESNQKKKAEVQLSGQKTSDKCDGLPFLYIHDVGKTLGYGWSKKDPFYVWPDAFDLKPWKDWSIWESTESCSIRVNGEPNGSWDGRLWVSEESRSLAANLFRQFSRQQLVDVFTAVRAEKMRGETVDSWVDGFLEKLQRDLLDVKCDA